ncbi:hypothetical protein FRC03_009386 [Tulasnella sp. 419]|nr:hypothetical protein FRC03_009386 [Tulasnella sp. 419]
MGPKEPTRNQYSRGLGYSAHTPAFLLRLQERVGGSARPDDLELDDGRPPIPTRPEGESSGDEEDPDEKPQVVVLKEGRHLSAREAENEKRKAKGLAPLPEIEGVESGESQTADKPVPSSSTAKLKSNQPLSFSSKKTSDSASKKRKTVGGDGGNPKGAGTTTDAAASRRPTKKGKKESKSLLSFGDDEN